MNQALGGTVVVQFVVDLDGNVSDVKAMERAGAGRVEGGGGAGDQKVANLVPAVQQRPARARDIAAAGDVQPVQDN